MTWEDFSAQIKHFSKKEQNLIKKAFFMGEEAHAGQMRKSGDPYFSHPIAVALTLSKWNADCDTVIAALLHDTVEDTALKLSILESAFGKTVATMIDGVTKMEEEDIILLPSMDQKIETLRKMFTLMQTDVRIMVIKLADRLHNMHTIQYRSEDKQHAVAKETMDVYVKIADRLCMRELRDELEMECRKILEPSTFPNLVDMRRSEEALSVNVIQKITKNLEKTFPSLKYSIHHEYRSWEKLRLQFEIELNAAETFPYINVEIICDSAMDCYLMLGAIHQLWRREVLTFDDCINTPAINGYKGLHTTIFLENGTHVRCKIRTKEMSAYAKNGITTVCFDSKAEGMLSCLPWTQRISSLSKDTKDFSNEFWNSLQNDILGESIVVYGPGNKTALIPEGATALDAALYLFPEDALRLTSIRINGKKAHLSQAVQKASTIEITTSTSAQVDRLWLNIVQTGIGIAIVREALVRNTDDDPVEIGKAMIQQELNERGEGYLEEFEKGPLEHSLLALGFHNVKELYTAVANKHLQVGNVISAVSQNVASPKLPGKNGKSHEDCTFVFTLNNDSAVIQRLFAINQLFDIGVRKIKMNKYSEKKILVRTHMFLSQQEQISYKQELLLIGAEKISVHRSSRQAFIFMSVVVFFWALNPVWARLLIEQGMTPISLVSIRSIVFGVLSVLTFIVWRMIRKKNYTPIQHLFRAAALPAITTFSLALLTYTSIFLLPPSVHLTVLRMNALIIPFLLIIKKFNLKNITQSFFILLITLGLLLLSPDTSMLGIFFALLSLIAYTAYSLITEKTMYKYKIGARYPYFLCAMGMILGIFGLSLLPFVEHQIDTWAPMLPHIAFYVFFCVYIPHICFHIVLQKLRFSHITSMSYIEIPLVMILEAFILGFVLDLQSYFIISLITIVLMLWEFRSIWRIRL